MKTFRILLPGFVLPLALAAQTPSPPATLDINAMKAQNARVTELNDLLTEANAAIRAGDWAKEQDIAEQLLAMNAKLMADYPDDVRFTASQPDYYKLLGDAELAQGQYDAAIAAYEKGVAAGEDLLKGGKDFAKIKSAVAQALIAEGNACLRLKKNQDALSCYKRAALIDPHPSVAWFNICAISFNTGNVSEAVAAADKVIELDPTKADAYFIKGACLFGNATTDAGGKIAVPAEALAALKKYLELAPNGPHAGDVKQMLDYAGVHTP